LWCPLRGRIKNTYYEKLQRILQIKLRASKRASTAMFAVLTKQHFSFGWASVQKDINQNA
jgi:hypothetical protein